MMIENKVMMLGLMMNKRVKMVVGGAIVVMMVIAIFEIGNDDARVGGWMEIDVRGFWDDDSD